MDRTNSLVSPIGREDFFCLPSRIASGLHSPHVVSIRRRIRVRIRERTWLYLFTSIASTEFWKRKIIERAVYIMEEEVSEANAERMVGNEGFQEVDTEREYDDFFQMEQSLGSEEEKHYEEEEWEEEIKPGRL